MGRWPEAEVAVVVSYNLVSGCDTVTLPQAVGHTDTLLPYDSQEGGVEGSLGGCVSVTGGIPSCRPGARGTER